MVKSYRESNTRYCSKDCMDAFRAGTEKKCQQCSEVFKVYKYRTDIARFCGRSCHYKSLVGVPSKSYTTFKVKDSRISGENNPNWKGGITGANDKIRKSRKYVLLKWWVVGRDGGRCVLCGEIWNGQSGWKNNLHVDHIKPFASFPELRFEPSNLRTLCVNCHRRTETWGRKKTTITN